MSGIADGSVINNFADIYFDFNSPVRTGTTVNTIDNNLSSAEIVSENSIHIYPNPATETAYLKVDGTAGAQYEMKITNVLGQEIKSAIGKCNQLMKIDLSKMQKGIYFINITGNNETVTVQKLIVQ